MKVKLKDAEKACRKRRLTITLESDQENSPESSEIFDHNVDQANEDAMNLISPITLSQAISPIVDFSYDSPDGRASK